MPELFPAVRVFPVRALVDLVALVRFLVDLVAPVFALVVFVEVFDVRGRRVATLVHGRQEAGEHVAPFGGARDGAGVYFYRLRAGTFSATRKMLYVK